MPTVGSCDVAEVVPSASDWLLTHLEVVPLMVFMVLPLKVALLVTFLLGSIADYDEAI